MKLLPRMGGAISIWLAATVMGLKHFTVIGVVTATLALLSINPLMYFKRDKSLVFPSLLAALSLYSAYLKPEVVPVLLLYSLLFALVKVVRERRISVKAGAIALTFPFPFMAVVSGASLAEIASPLTLLYSLTIFNLFLADSKVYNSVSMKNYLSIIPLAVVLFLLSPATMFLSVIAATTAIAILSPSLSIKKFGFSLLFLHLLFALEYVLLF
jgi:hypothetical protein